MFWCTAKSTPKRPVLGATLLAAGLALTMGGCGGIIDSKAEEQFGKDLGRTSITVYPAVVRTQTLAYDGSAATQIAAALNADGIANASATDVHAPLTGGWSHDQSRMWRESARAFADYVKAHPPGTPYAALPEYLLLGPGPAATSEPSGAPDRVNVGGIHLYVVDMEGRVVKGIGLNSHHKPFTDANPQSVADCTQVIIDRLRAEWK